MSIAMTRRLSLVEEIEAAETAEEVNQILARGRNYFAGTRTKKRWQSRAKRRLAQLRNGGSKHDA